MTQLPDLWQDPSCFLRDINLKDGAFLFQQTSRHALSSAPFLDDRFFDHQPQSNHTTPSCSPADSLKCSFAFRDLPPPEPGNVPGNYIFHTAFCCSTLLASVLDRPGKVLALKEPGVLMTLANLQRTSSKTDTRAAQVQQNSRLENLQQISFQLLSRRFEPEEKILLQPTNAANNLLEPVLRSGARVLLLYSDLSSFLISIIKKDEACRYFVRHLLNILRLDRPDIDAWTDRQRMLLTDLQVAALVWSIQIDHFERCLLAAPRDQIRSLNTDTFLDNHYKTLHGLNDFFQCGYQETDIALLMDSTRFKQHSKYSDQDYDNNVRLAERNRVEKQHGDAISVTLDWTRRLRENYLPDSLPHALLAEF